MKVALKHVLLAYLFLLNFQIGKNRTRMARFYFEVLAAETVLGEETG